jgi:hypothetical protein
MYKYLDVNQTKLSKSIMIKNKMSVKHKVFYATFSNPIDIERKNRLLTVCYVPAASTTFLAFFSFFLVVAISSTNEANKAGSTHR